MKPRRRRHCSRWFHFGLIIYGAIAGVSIAFLSFFVISPPVAPAHATGSDNVMGWAWADPIGWISLNDQNPGSGGGSYGVGVDLATGAISGFGWSPHVGWVCFGTSCGVAECAGVVPPSNAPYNGTIADIVPAPLDAGPAIREIHGWAKVCSLDDEGWLSLNCQDPDPSTCDAYNYHVAFDATTQEFSDATPPGSPDNGTSFGWNGNDAGSGIGYVDFSRAYLVPASEGDDVVCADAIDNDIDGAIDCADPGCAATAPCLPPPPDLTEDQCPLGTADLCCSDNTDNEGNGVQDCDDPACQGNASMCTIDWLKTRFGNVYAQQGIASIEAPANQYNATYCLSAANAASITGFSSQVGCTSEVGTLSLPKQSTGYRGTLGSIDISGIVAGRYGTVVPIGSGDALPVDLDGKIYLYEQPGTIHVPARVFQNAVGGGRRGNGLLLVIGADVVIDGDLTYAATDVDTSLRNLASFGLIAIVENGAGGNISIDRSVSTISGAMYAENTISTGADASPLTAYGLLAARNFAFERNAGSSSTASEEVIFDGRALVNPPPGMQDVGKTLPRVQDAF